MIVILPLPRLESLTSDIFHDTYLVYSNLIFDKISIKYLFTHSLYIQIYFSLNFKVYLLNLWRNQNQHPLELFDLEKRPEKKCF